MAESSVTAMLEQSAEKWRTCEGAPASELLRLSVLRDLLHGLHAQKSRFLSLGKREAALSIREIELRIEGLRTAKPLAGDLSELISSPAEANEGSKLKKRTRVLPDALFEVLEREKLERYDRQWEAALASEALTQGWRIWSLEARIEIRRIDEWNRRLVDSLWPDGIVLYVESATTASSAAQEDAGPAPGWLGRWVCLLNGQFRASADILVDFSKWPGTQSAPSWRQLFSPKRL